MVTIGYTMICWIVMIVTRPDSMCEVRSGQVKPICPKLLEHGNLLDYQVIARNLICYMTTGNIAIHGEFVGNMANTFPQISEGFVTTALAACCE